ncbi:MAG: helix-hairpin-helix domain-containing protein, partial [Blastocatellia bacterium]
LVDVIDVACGSAVNSQRFPGLFLRGAAAISHDGTRAYFASFEQILMVDAGALREMKRSAAILPAGQVQGPMVLSPDDSRLFVGVFDFDGNNSAIHMLDASDLSSAITKSVTGTLTSLALSPDGSRLYASVITSGVASGQTNGEARVFDAVTLQQIGAAIKVGDDPIAIALTPDGQRAIVANQGSKTISVVDIATGNVFEPVSFGAALTDSPVSMALAPDGMTAYVVTKHPDITRSGQIRVVDFNRSRVVKAIEAQNAVSLALAPSGDWLYVRGSDDSLITIQVGTHFPLEWNLTSGRVALKCLPKPFLRIVELGQSGGAAITPSSLSQVAPVAAGCAYEFSFLAIADQPDAVAEILWLNSQCGLIKTDQIPIEVRAVTPTQDPDENGGDLFAIAATPDLALHRARLAAPAGADQAEVRFTVPAGGLACIDSVSLMGTDETVINGDFLSESQGRLGGWTVSPAVSPGFSVIASADGVKLQNAGASAVTLKQTIPAKGNQPFALEFQGRTTKLSTNQADPRIEASWLDAGGSVIGAPVVMEIFADNFGASVANGTSPENAVQAEIGLIIPPGIVEQAPRVSLRFNPATQIPLTFVAQSPGELVITDLQVAFEEAEVAPPPIPERGLCRATPPGRAPGETPHDCCFCPDCAGERTMIEVEPMQTRAGRPVSVGICSECGLELAHFGGRRAAARSSVFLGVFPAVFPAAGAARPMVIRASSIVTRASSITPLQPADDDDRHALTEIEGIGEATARRLEEIGIDSVTALAEASPDKLTQLKGITTSKARQFISAAKKLL